MNQNPQTQEKPARYEPRDPHFYLLAVCMLSAALVPATANPTYHAADHTQADETARKAAQILDGAPAPDGFLQRAIARRLAEIREYQSTVGLTIDPRHVPTGVPVRIGTAAEVERARKAEAARAEKDGPMPSVEELKDQNAKDLTRFRDLSEPVRDAALRSSAVRLAATHEITGARPEEAIGIVCEEIMRALRIAEEIGLPTRSLPENASMSDAAMGVPYPANMPAMALIGGMAQIEETVNDAIRQATDAEPETPPTKAQRPAPPEGT